MLNHQLDFLYSAGETRRFHTWPILRERTIAHHSWHVAMLLYIIFGQDEPGISPMLLMAALTHDAAEWRFGDIPSPAKRGMSKLMPDFREKWGLMEEAELSTVGFDFDKFLSDEERRRLKLADAMEGALYCCVEREMGNTLIELPYANFEQYIREVLDISNQHEHRVFAYIQERWWSAANGALEANHGTL